MLIIFLCIVFHLIHATDDKANLSRLSWLKEFTSKIGFSDHTLSTVIPALSVFYGCEVIEKHFTTDKDLPGEITNLH